MSAIAASGPDTNPERRLFLEARDITDPDARIQFLKQACENVGTRKRIESLLKAADSTEADNFLEDQNFNAGLDPDVSGFIREVAGLQIEEDQREKRLARSWSQPDIEAVKENLAPGIEVSGKLQADEFGAHYAAAITETGQSVNVRIFPSPLTSAASFPFKFSDHLSKVIKVQHKLLLPLIVFDHFSIASTKYYFVVSEHSPLPSLASKISKEKIDAEPATKIIKQLIELLVEIKQTSKLSHGGLSSEHIFVSDDLQSIQVGNFGLNFTSPVCDLKALGFLIGEFNHPEFGELSRKAMLGDFQTLEELLSRFKASTGTCSKP